MGKRTATSAVRKTRTCSPAAPGWGISGVAPGWGISGVALGWGIVAVAPGWVVPGITPEGGGATGGAGLTSEAMKDSATFIAE
ncbi:MAG TPA: hypothetical protein PKH24_16130 [Sedimentisphaerales bacterium]|nr:hypothetical protein [Sedimentisphaerales bacterium]HNU31336.1 hypothetical protein [Sedimentisphaerales bacterium]